VAALSPHRIKTELGVDTGKRYSWGYGACPDLDDHATVFKLLPAKEALDMDLTEAFQLLPEQSTAAVILHHPDAKYYAVRGTSPGVSTGAEAAVA
jgi:5-methyltetrahydrofolate--homocysteine methyltransferase